MTQSLPTIDKLRDDERFKTFVAMTSMLGETKCAIFIDKNRNVIGCFNWLDTIKLHWNGEISNKKFDEVKRTTTVAETLFYSYRTGIIRKTGGLDLDSEI